MPISTPPRLHAEFLVFFFTVAAVLVSMPRCLVALTCVVLTTSDAEHPVSCSSHRSVSKSVASSSLADESQVQGTATCSGSHSE